MVLPERWMPTNSFLAFSLLASSLALLFTVSTTEVIDWINWRPNANFSAPKSQQSYTDAELNFQRQLHKDRLEKTEKSGHEQDGNLSNDTMPNYADYIRAKPVCPVGLPLGNINLLVVTDIHGWIAGQHARHEPYLNVDMGDLVSFYQQLQWQQNPPWYEKLVTRPTGCPPQGDWFLLFNGDMMDGTGISTIPPNHMAPLLQQVPFSALNTGNHELYHNEVVDYMMNQGFIHHWDGNYLASNVDYIPQQQNKNAILGPFGSSVTSATIPFGNRYTFLRGPVLNSTILTFGFLYNFVNNCNHTMVQTVEETLQEVWFVNVLTTSKYDAIIVMGHMDAVDPLVYKILEAIRALVGANMPIQFITGHSHRRHFEQLDTLSTSMEAGRFMDTIGFVSFPLKSTTDYIRKLPANKDSLVKRASSLFQHEFLDANYKVLGTDVLGMPDQDFSTLKGRALSFSLKQTQKRMGLLEVVAECAPQDYILEKPLNDTDSLWWLFIEQIIPTTFFPMLEATDSIPIFIQGTGALRYSLFSPTVVVDDIVAVTPFENPIYQVGSRLTAEELLQVLDALQVDDVSPQWPSFGVAGPRPSVKDKSKNNKRYDLYTVSFHLSQAYEEVKNATRYDSNAEPFTPRPVYEPMTDNTDDPKQLGITKLWMDFIKGEWKCPEEESSFGDQPLRRQQYVPSMMAALSMLMFVMLALFVRRLQSQSKQQKKLNLDSISESSPLLPDSVVHGSDLQLDSPVEYD